MNTHRQSLSELENRLRHTFSDRELLEEALCHRSFVNEHPRRGYRDNERLEFLGDAVLGLVIAHLLMESFPGHSEGDLSRIRAYLVSEQELAEIARTLGLGVVIRLGRGEDLSNGRDKDSILADALEAVIAAVYLDAGFDAASRFIEAQYQDRILQVDPISTGSDYKSRLQELLQFEQKTQPSYSVVEESGPDHDKTFRVRMQAGPLTAEGVGKSKKLAEQAAARTALRQVEDS